MVMKLLRDTASGGMGKFILFGFLVLAVAGLALTDVGGFFRTGGGSNDVMKIGSRTVGIQDFDMTVRRQLGPLGISVEDAYKAGFMDRILAGEVQRLVLEDFVNKSGLHIPDERIATHIVQLLEPMAQDGQTPADVLEGILYNQRMSQDEFATGIGYEMSVKFLEESFQAGKSLLPVAMVDDLYRFSKETRTVEYLKFHDTEMKPEDPTDEELRVLYDSIKEEYLIPEHRAITVLMIDDSALMDDPMMDSVTIVDKKYEMLDAMEAKLDEGMALEDIVSESDDDLPLKLLTIPSLPASGTVLDGSAEDLTYDDTKNLAAEAFALFDSGDVSSVIKLANLRFAAIRLDDIKLSSYHAFDKLKSQLKARWLKNKQHQMTTERTESVLATLNESGQSFEEYADTNKRNYRTAGPLTRNKPELPFTQNNIVSIFTSEFDGDTGPIMTLPIDGGLTLVRVKDVKFPKITEETRAKDDYKSLHDTAELLMFQARLDSIVEYLYSQETVWVNKPLLDRVYGGTE